MKIGIVTTWFERGAGYVSKLYEEILKVEHEVYIYARGGEKYAIGNPDWDKENVYWGRRYSLPITSTYIDEKDFINWIKSNKIETVLFNEQDWWQTLLVCKKMGIKIGGYIDYYTEATINLFNIYDFLICNTKKHHSVFSDHAQSYYVPWGTDTELFLPKKIESKEKEVLVYFHSAGMNPFRKGTDQVIKAFTLLSKKHVNVKLIIHTQVSLNSYFQDLIETIDDLINKHQLEIIEKTVTAPGLYNLGDIYVYPSRLEGIGLTIAEALSCGLPVITSNNAPMNEFVTHPSQAVSINKFYCRQDAYYWPICEVNIEDLADKMEFYVDNLENLDAYKKMTREYALEKLTWKNNKKQVNEIFTKTKTLAINNEIIIAINKKDNSKYPLITKYPGFYKYAYKIFNFFVKTNY